MSANFKDIFCLSNSYSFSRRVSLLWDNDRLPYLAEEHNDTWEEWFLKNAINILMCLLESLNHEASEFEKQKKKAYLKLSCIYLDPFMSDL